MDALTAQIVDFENQGTFFEIKVHERPNRIEVKLDTYRVTLRVISWRQFVLPLLSLMGPVDHLKLIKARLKVWRQVDRRLNHHYQGMVVGYWPVYFINLVIELVS